MNSPRFVFALFAALVGGSLSAQPTGGRTDTLLKVEASSRLSSINHNALWWMRPDGTTLTVYFQEVGLPGSNTPTIYVPFNAANEAILGSAYTLGTYTNLTYPNTIVQNPDAAFVLNWDNHTTSYLATSHFVWMSRTEAPMSNTSVRGYATAEHGCIAGLTLTQNRYVLARAIGPALATFGVSDALPNPVLRVYSGTKVINDSETMSSDAFYAAQHQPPALWYSYATFVHSMKAIFEMVGAFPLPENAADRATLMLLPAGSYTFEVKPRDGTPAGSALAEVYVLPYGEEVTPR